MFYLAEDAIDTVREILQTNAIYYGKLRFGITEITTSIIDINEIYPPIADITNKCVSYNASIMFIRFYK